MAPSGNVKKLLSEAQKSVQSKDFSSAVAKCKDVLKEDKFNAWAFLLLGAAYKDTDKNEAVKYLRLARNSSEHSTKALQGLFHCAEDDELIDVCKQLLQLTPAKFTEITTKLVTVAINVPSNSSACLGILCAETMVEQTDRQACAYACICKVFAANSKDFDSKHKELYEKTVAFVAEHFSAEQLLDIENAVNLLEIAYKQKCYRLLVRLACRLADVSRRQTVPLEWICKVHCEHSTGIDTELKGALHNIIDEYVARLLYLTPNSTLGLMSKGLCLVAKFSYMDARDVLLKVNDQQPNWNICLKQLAFIYKICTAWTLAEYFQKKTKIVDVELAKSLSEQNVKEKTLEAIQLCKELLPTATETSHQVSLVAILAKSLIDNDQLEAAQKTIQKLSAMSETDLANILLSHLHSHTGDHVKALEILVNNPCHVESSDYYLQLSRQHFELKQYELALECGMRAIRIEPFNSNSLCCLGKIYLAIDEQVKAIKCLAKCTFLHPQHEQGVQLLSAIYRQTGNWTANSGLLTAAVNAVPGVQCNWASNQLGFHYLGQNDFNAAINAFRVALRSDVDNQSSWEGLADAYLQRGSLNSSLKVYQKIVELNPKALYPKLQVANVKTMLRLHKEATESYEALLAEEPNYFPALKGIAEAHLGLTHYYLTQRLLGRSRSHAVESVGYLIRAIQIKGDVACLWRMMANAFETIGSFPSEHAVIEVPGSLANVNEKSVTLAGDKLFEFASRFYCRALKIRNHTDELIWYELSLTYYLRAVRQKDAATKMEYLRLATESIKHTIKLAPSRWKSWNLLGVICATKEINNLALAQHSFIKAITIDKKSAVSWTNLGVLYLIKGDIQLANKAFGRAQQSDTGYIHAWTGQACIAETIAQHDEALDLFKHCTSLGYTPESSLGFTHWVCTVLCNEKLRTDVRFSYAIEHLHAASSAMDSITWYCNGEDVSLESLCFSGYLLYRQQLYKRAASAFEKAAQLADGVTKDKILCNLGYSHLKAGQPELAVVVFQSVTEATFESTIGLAFAHFKAAQYEASYSVYESALEWLATEEAQKAMILVAMSAMVYSFQGDADAKSLLFQCIGLPKPPIEGLFSGCALGILHDDMQLSELVLQELKRFENNPKFSHHVVFLMSQFYLKTDGTHKALIYILGKVHHQPGNALIRKVLANFLLKNCTKTKKFLVSAGRIAESSIYLQMKNLKCENSSMDCAKSMAMASEAMRFVDQKIRKKLAQRAILLNPTCKEAWSALILCNA